MESIVGFGVLDIAEHSWRSCCAGVLLGFIIVLLFIIILLLLGVLLGSMYHCSMYLINLVPMYHWLLCLVCSNDAMLAAYF